MAHVFISYSKKDRDYARKLADELLARGFDVWIDDRIDFSANWEREIFRAVDECSAFVILMTPDAYDSLWVQRERQYADRREKPAFPLLLEGEVFPFYGVVQYYDVQGGVLPGANFLEDLAKFAPQHATPGQDIASAPQQQAKIKAETGEVAVPENAASRSAAGRGQTPRGTLVTALAALLVVVAAVLFLALRRPPADSLNRPTAPAATARSGVPTPFGGGRGEIAFQSDADGSSDLYVINIDGSGVRNLTQNAATDTDMSWSPDGLQIAFTSDRGAPPGNLSLYVMDADGGNARQLGEGIAGWSPAWSPDGTRLAFTMYGSVSAEIFVMTLANLQPTPLTDNLAADDYAAWSPDGSQIAFVSDRDGSNQLYLMNADGSDQRRLVASTVSDSLPAWSPDGRQIAFQSDGDGDTQVFVINTDGSNRRALAVGYQPAWSADGTQIVFSSYREGGSAGLYAMNADGSDVRRITNGATEHAYPSWRP